MPSITVKVVNKQEVLDKLNRMKGENARMVMQRTMSDMGKKGPSIISKFTSTRYMISAAKVNPNTKAGSGRGSVGMTGGLAGITFVYRGRMLAIGGGASAREGSFPLSPRTVSYGRRQTFKTQVLRGGGRNEVGHYARPNTEGGAYSAKSPGIPFPGVGTPVERRGDRLSEGFKGPSVPAMVGKEETQAMYMPFLEQALWESLSRHVHNIL